MRKQKGSGTARPAPSANKAGNSACHAAPKDHGRPAADKSKGNRTAPGTQGKSVGFVGGLADKGNKQAAVVVCTKSSHPDCAPGTFDAAALLKSVLEVVEPTLKEGLETLEKTLLRAHHEAGAEVLPNGQVMRGVERRIAEAVRAAVIEGMRTRDRHLAQLAVIDRAAVQTDTVKRLKRRIRTELERAGLRRVVDLENLSLFNLADGAGLPPGGETDLGTLELVTPAYVDADTGRVVERGWVRRLPLAEAPEPPGKKHGGASHQNEDKNDRSSGGWGAADETSASTVGANTDMPQSAAPSTRPLSDGVGPCGDASSARSAGLPPGKRPGGEIAGRVAPESVHESASDEADLQQRGQRKRRRQGTGPVFSIPAEAANQDSRHGTWPGSAGEDSDPSGHPAPSDSAGRESTNERQADPERANGKASRRDPAVRDASRIPSSFFVRRLLGDAAENGQPPRRSS